MIEINDRLEAITKFKFKAQDGTEYSIFDFIYPIGCLYWSNENINPSELFGGVWKQITDTFILACGDKHKPNENGGMENITLTDSNIPSHTHSFSVSGTTESSLNNAWFHLGWEKSKGVFSNSIAGDIEEIFPSIGSSIEQDNEFTYHKVKLKTQHTHSFSYSGTTDSNGNGSGTSFSILPPYVVKYCWERIA